MTSLFVFFQQCAIVSENADFFLSTMIRNDNFIGLMFFVLFFMLLLAVAAIASFFFDLHRLVPAVVFGEQERPALRHLPSGAAVSAPGGPELKRVPYPVVRVGREPTVFRPQATLVPRS